jgi:membrane-associated phospholipid phosphatase
VVPSHIDELLLNLLELNGSDLHLTAGAKPTARVHGKLRAMDQFIRLDSDRVKALVYGALYLFLIVLPVFVVREPEHIRRTFLAYLAVWMTAYIVFLTYPTIAPRPEKVIGSGFANWGLRFLYEADPPYNCFPSLHVAHSFVSALTCYAVHRRVGIFATVAAALVALSTLLTKQHYVLDVVAGVSLAYVAYAIFLRSYRRDMVPARDRHIAPVLAVSTLAMSAIAIVGYWVAYVLSGPT